jgi:hypothetical protein
MTHASSNRAPRRNGKTSIYEVSAVIPPHLISPLLELLQKKGGQLLRMTNHNANRPEPRKHGKEPAHEVILSQLLKEDGELHRTDLRKALEASGHSPQSVGPICSMLQKQGRVFSPRRGFWQLRT